MTRNWEYDECCGSVIEYDVDTNEMRELVIAVDGGANEKDLMLMAAAPALLEACKELLARRSAGLPMWLIVGAEKAIARSGAAK